MQHVRYSVAIEFLNVELTAPFLAPDNALLPSTHTGLPAPLDAELRTALPHLCLPKTFWQPLPRSKQLDTTSSPSLLPPSVSAPPPPNRRVWSENTNTAYAPAIATADLYTPSQGTQKATLDFRFGPLSLDWVDDPDPLLHVLLTMPLSPVSSTTSLPVPGPSTQRARAGSSGDRSSAAISVAKEPERAGTTSLYWGSVHLYREAGVEGKSSEKDKRAAVEADDGTVVGMISVPGNITAASLLSFISPALDSVAQMRMIRDSTPNRTMVLIRFRDASEASEFKVMYNGKPYHDTKESELCHVVSISSIKLKSSTAPPYTFPYSQDLEPKSSEEAVELPTCPVCLERMDTNSSGLITVVCQHSFHCNCLLKWGDSRCPVCRSTNYRTRKATLSTPATSRCTICQSPSNLWICLICGNVGCGRYQGGHAHSHFSESAHAYSMELETQRVWDYVTDSYVHRLIRNRADGKLVELPSLSAKSDEDAEDKKKSDGLGPDKDTEENQDKLEAMGIEYAHLMTSQLDSQREYYEEEVARIKDELRVTKAKWEEAFTENGKWRKEKALLEKRCDEILVACEKDLADAAIREDLRRKSDIEEEARRKKERADAGKARKEVEKQLEAERAVSASLSANLGHLRSEVKKHEEESKELRGEVDDLREQMRDVMFALSARDQIEAEGGAANEAAGGSVSVPTPPPPPPTSSARRKKKR